MNKEDILEKSRKENKSKDLVEMELDNQAWNTAGRAGMAACCLLSTFIIILSGQVPESPWVIYFCMLGTRSAFRYYKLRKGSELGLTVLYFSMCTVWLVILVLKLLGIKP